MQIPHLVQAWILCELPPPYMSKIMMSVCETGKEDGASEARQAPPWYHGTFQCWILFWSGVQKSHVLDRDREASWGLAQSSSLCTLMSMRVVFLRQLIEFNCIRYLPYFADSLLRMILVFGNMAFKDLSQKDNDVLFFPRSKCWKSSVGLALRYINTEYFRSAQFVLVSYRKEVRSTSQHKASQNLLGLKHVSACSKRTMILGVAKRFPKVDFELRWR